MAGRRHLWAPQSVKPSASAASGLESRKNCAQRSLLGGLPDLPGSARECGDRAQEAAVRLVRPRHRALTAPAGLAQLIERAVVAGAGVGVGLDREAGRERDLGEQGPGQRRLRVMTGRERRVTAGEQLGRCRVFGQQRLGDTQQVLGVRHASTIASTPPQPEARHNEARHDEAPHRSARGFVESVAAIRRACRPSAGSGRPRRRAGPCRPRPPYPRRAGRTSSCCRPRRRSSGRRRSSSSCSRRRGG